MMKKVLRKKGKLKCDHEVFLGLGAKGQSLLPGTGQLGYVPDG